jgi:hypothetical protein
VDPYVTRNSPHAPLLKRSAPDVPLPPMTSVWIESLTSGCSSRYLKFYRQQFKVLSEPDYSTDPVPSTNSCARFAPLEFADPSL